MWTKYKDLIKKKKEHFTKELVLLENRIDINWYHTCTNNFILWNLYYLISFSISNCSYKTCFKSCFVVIADITCQRPNLQTSSALQLNTNTLQQTFSYNDSISFTCSLGYILQGPTKKYCQQIGDFEHNLPTCAGVNIILFSFLKNLNFIYWVIYRIL